MRREIVEIILVILTLNLFLASTTLASPGTAISIDPSLIQDNQIKPGAPIMKSYPSADAHNATVTGDTNAYDKNPSTYATVTLPSGTSTSVWYYFDVKTFNSSLTKQYISLDLGMHYNVSARRAAYRFVLYVGPTRVVLQAASTANTTAPTVKTWSSVTEPNDGQWSQADINNLILRVEVRRTSSSGAALTFKEYEGWGSIPGDSFSVRINLSDVSQMVLWQINITFNPSVLELVSIQEGSFLKSFTPPPPYLPPGTNFYTLNGSGWVQAFCGLKSYSYGGISGSGLLATIGFRAIAEGNSVLTYSLPETYLMTWTGDPPELVDIPCDKSSSFFQYLIGDCDGDGDVDGVDFGIFAPSYGSLLGQPAYRLICDIDRDGDVDGVDFGMFAPNYGKT